MGRMKSILITGAAGFIGSHLVDRYLSEGFRVIGVDNFLTGSRDNIVHLTGNRNFHFIEQDVIEPFDPGESVQLVLHFACPASPVDYMAHPIETMKVDSYGTLNTLEIARKNGARYLFASTSEIYGDPKVHPQPETYWGNVNTLGPRSVYDEAKRFSEALTMAYYTKNGLDTRLVRIFNTYGPRMRLNDGRVVPNFIPQAIRGEDLTVFGDGKQTRSFCYVSDTVDGIFRLSQKDGLAGEVVNIGNPDEYTILEFAKIIIAKLGAKSSIVHCDLPKDDPRQRKPDIAKAKCILDWEPRTSLDQGLGETIAYFHTRLGQ
jgi:nucleoside-diphosphate-sugar epimerase